MKSGELPVKATAHHFIFRSGGCVCGRRGDNAESGVMPRPLRSRLTSLRFSAENLASRHAGLSGISLLHINPMEGSGNTYVCTIRCPAGGERRSRPPHQYPIPASIDDLRHRGGLSGTCRFIRFPEADGHVDTPGELDGNLRLPKATLRGCAGIAARPRPSACADMAVPV